MITWVVTTREPTTRKTVVICQADTREGAKRIAHPELGGNSDTYIVDPITRPQDMVVLRLKVEGRSDDPLLRRIGW